MLLLLGCSLSLAFGQVAPPPLQAALGKPQPEQAPAQVAITTLRLRFRPTAPVYPPLARLARLQGMVTLRLTLNEMGFVEKAESLNGPAALRLAAEAFGTQWLFEPVQKDGKGVRVQTQMGVAFRLGISPRGRFAETPPTRGAFGGGLQLGAFGAH